MTASRQSATILQSVKNDSQQKMIVSQQAGSDRKTAISLWTRYSILNVNTRRLEADELVNQWLSPGTIQLNRYFNFDQTSSYSTQIKPHSTVKEKTDNVFFNQKAMTEKYSYLISPMDDENSSWFILTPTHQFQNKNQSAKSISLWRSQLNWLKRALCAWTHKVTCHLCITSQVCSHGNS